MIEEIEFSAWFDELIFAHKTRAFASKKFTVNSKGFIDRITSLYGTHDWVWYTTKPTQQISQQTNDFYDLDFIYEEQLEEIMSKLEKAYNNWLFTRAIEKELGGE